MNRATTSLPRPATNWTFSLLNRLAPSPVGGFRKDAKPSVLSLVPLAGKGLRRTPFRLAKRQTENAEAIDETLAEAHHRHSLFLCWMGRFPEALAELQRAQRLDPTSLIINADLGLALYFARRYGEAIGQFRKND